MENKRIIIGNLKMNMVASEINDYLKEVNKKINNSDVVICPSSLYIPYFLKQKYKVGIQNIASAENGAHTGEISASQASSLGVEYVIIGHSERRQMYGDTDLLINKKVKLALANNLIPIICVGETNEDKVMFRTEKVINKQITYALRDLSKEDMEKVIIAYEPVWAIGTNVIPTNSDIKNAVSYIKALINTITQYNDAKVLYGGSVNKKNVSQLIKINEVDGFLIGGASLKPDEFSEIIEVAVSK